MVDGNVGKLAGLHANVGAHDRIGVTVIRYDVIGALRHEHDVTGHHALRDRPLVARLKLAALVDVERNLPGGMRTSPTLPSMRKPPAGISNTSRTVVGAQFHRLDRAGEPEATWTM